MNSLSNSPCLSNTVQSRQPHSLRRSGICPSKTSWPQGKRPGCHRHCDVFLRIKFAVNQKGWQLTAFRNWIGKFEAGVVANSTAACRCLATAGSAACWGCCGLGCRVTLADSTRNLPSWPPPNCLGQGQQQGQQPDTELRLDQWAQHGLKTLKGVMSDSAP